VQANLPSTDETTDQVRVVDRLAQLYPAIATVPGVRSVAGGVGLPMGSSGSNGSYAVEGKHTFAPGQKLPYANFRLASPGLFETIGVPLRRGRDFSTQDRYDAPFVVIVSEALVREIFPREDPIGHRIQCGLVAMHYMTIGGVVGMLAIFALRREAPALGSRAKAKLNWPLLVLAAFLGQYVSMVLWMAGYKYTEASVAAVLNETASVFIVLLAALFLHEGLDARRIAGVTCTLSGVACMLFA